MTRILWWSLISTLDVSISPSSSFTFVSYFSSLFNWVYTELLLFKKLTRNYSGRRLTLIRIISFLFLGSFLPLTLTAFFWLSFILFKLSFYSFSASLVLDSSANFLFLWLTMVTFLFSFLALFPLGVTDLFLALGSSTTYPAALFTVAVFDLLFFTIWSEPLMFYSTCYTTGCYSIGGEFSDCWCFYSCSCLSLAEINLKCSTLRWLLIMN